MRRIVLLNENAKTKRIRYLQSLQKGLDPNSPEYKKLQASIESIDISGEGRDRIHGGEINKELAQNKKAMLDSGYYKPDSYEIQKIDNAIKNTSAGIRSLKNKTNEVEKQSQGKSDPKARDAELDNVN